MFLILRSNVRTMSKVKEILSEHALIHSDRQSPMWGITNRKMDQVMIHFAEKC